MPESYRCPDDDTLLLIFREDDQDIVLETAYAIYRLPFVSFFNAYFALSVPEAEDLFRQALKVLIADIQAKTLAGPCPTSVFKILLTIGFLRYEQEDSRGKVEFERKLKRLKRFYFEADILITLIEEEDEVAFELVHYGFEDPTFKLLQHKTGVGKEQLDFDPQEYYQRATKKLKEKIREKAPNSPKVPMEARLFTYFYRIATFEFKNFSKRWRKVFHPDEQSHWENILAPAEIPPSYLDYILEKWPQVNRYQFDNARDLLKSIGGSLTRVQMQMLRDLIDGKSYEDIAEKEGKTKKAVRKMAFDIRKKIRKELGIEPDEPDA